MMSFSYFVLTYVSAISVVDSLCVYLGWEPGEKGEKEIEKDVLSDVKDKGRTTKTRDAATDE